MFQSTTSTPNSNEVHLNRDSSDLAQAKPSNGMHRVRTVLSRLWRLRPRFDVESMYLRDARDLPTPDPFKPTSLSGKQVADIWLLNSKL